MLFLDFESGIGELEKKLDALKETASDPQSPLRLDKEIARIEHKLYTLLEKTYTQLTPWQKVQVARHPERPRSAQYIHRLIEDFFPLAGDRCFGEDKAILGGIGRFRGTSVMVIAHAKSGDAHENAMHNFGMAHPEGYRKVLRLMDLAHRFSLPLLAFVDTPGAYPGIGAEERGQAQAIAACLEKSLTLRVPFISTVIGEGGSGGAIAMATADRICMLEHAVYAVISPEGCSSILWHTKDKREEAAKSQKITAKDLKTLGIVDDIISEPPGGAHRSPLSVIDTAGDHIERHLKELQHHSGPNFDQSKDRRKKFLAMTRDM